MQPLDVLLVRHATPILPGTPGWEGRDDARPLSPEGQRQAGALAIDLAAHHLTAAYSSPYPRAIETVEPTASRRGLDVELLPDLRERRLRSTPGGDWRDQLERSWADPDLVLEGGESSRAAQARGTNVLNQLRAAHPDGGCLLVGSHGNLISLVLQAFEPRIGAAFHLAMPMPAVYRLRHDGAGWRIMGGPGLPAVEAGRPQAGRPQAGLPPG